MSVIVNSLIWIDYYALFNYYVVRIIGQRVSARTTRSQGRIVDHLLHNTFD